MYSFVFISVLILLSCWKIHKLIKNKRNSGNFEWVDEELVIMLNKGDPNG